MDLKHKYSTPAVQELSSETSLIQINSNDQAISLRFQTVASGASPCLRTNLILAGMTYSQNCDIC